MKHHRWDKHGRTFSHADEGKPRTFTYKSRVGESNVDVNGDGKTFAPYVMDGDELRHGHNRCSFADGHQDIGKGGKSHKSKIFVQRETSPGVWETIDHGKPTRTHEDVSGRCLTTLAFPDMAAGEFSMEILAGGSDKQHYGFKFHYPEAGTFRLEWVFDVPADDGVSDVELGVKVGEKILRWTKAEVPNRSVVVDDPKGNRKTVRVFMGPYALGANEQLSISPDTWGTDVGIAASADDGYSKGPAEYNWFSNSDAALYVGNASAAEFYAAYFRWTGLSSIPMGATIVTALFDTYVSDHYAGGDSTLYAWDADDPGACTTDVGSRVYDVPRTTANVPYVPATTGWYTLSSAAFVAVVQEIFSSYATDTMVLLVIGVVGTSNYNEIEAYDNAGTNEAELTITYTTGDVSLPLTGVCG